MARIAFASTMLGYPWGGSEELWGQAALRLARAGYRIAAHTLWWPEPASQVIELRQSGVRFYFRYGKRHIREAASQLGSLLLTGSWPPEHAWLKRFRPDLVVISNAIQTSGHRIAKACRKRRLRYVIIVQSASEWHWPDDQHLDQLAQIYQNAEMVFFVSRENQELTERQLGLRLPQAKVVWNPFNVRYDAELAWPTQDNGLRLACVARLEPRSKAQDLLLEVLRQVKWRDRAISLSLFGRGPNENKLREMARRDGLENVHFHGHSNDVEAIWSSHHALILPSRYEGTPLVVVEAMLCGRPCIVTKTAGRELVADGITGFVAPAPEVGLIDAALERAWGHRDELKQIGERAATNIRQSLPRDPVGDFVQELRALL